MTLTQKEVSLLTDLQAQEQLCIEKYGKYAELAHDCALRALFTSLKETEQKHHATITEMMSGTEVKMPASPPSAESSKKSFEMSAESQENKQSDAYLCRDALSMEKHVSTVYNTGIFEFKSPVLRDTLAHIQKEEQNHGEQLYSYLAANNMY